MEIDELNAPRARMDHAIHDPDCDFRDIAKSPVAKMIADAATKVSLGTVGVTRYVEPLSLIHI